MESAADALHGACRNSGCATVVAYTNGTADPDGPILRSQQNGAKETLYDLPAASVVVIRGSVSRHARVSLSRVLETALTAETQRFEKLKAEDQEAIIESLESL